ncbi:MAG TPA: RNA methyltransferase, partial [Polyangiaceae bacterium]|nr:RNA methyltransferase [Polyangiaceae bacterium]
MRRCAIALVHHPVLDGQGATVTTAVTNLDVHDLARSARSFGCSDYFVAHPIAAQRELVNRIRGHWIDGSGGR